MSYQEIGGERREDTIETSIDDEKAGLTAVCQPLFEGSFCSRTICLPKFTCARRTEGSCLYGFDPCDARLNDPDAALRVVFKLKTMLMSHKAIFRKNRFFLVW